MNFKIVSGGQTGVDRDGLESAIVSSVGIDPSGGVVFVGEFDIYCELSVFACGDCPRIL